jgi:uncharacterized membrane-anchored protein YitT (DUF2179 family)
MNQTIKEYFWISVGVGILSLGLLGFLFPADLAVGGISGFVLVVNHYFPMIPRGIMLLGLSILLFILGYIIIGKEFGGRTLYSSLLLSGIIMLVEALNWIQKPFVEDIFLNLFFGILIGGVGVGIVFSQNASTGGTDIIAKIINKYFDTDIGKSLMMADFIVVILAMFAFGVELGLYAMMGIIFNSFVIDNMVEGFDRKYLITIVSNRTPEIQDFIINDLSRGLTVYDAKGGYTDREMEVLNAVMGKRDFIKCKKFIADIDPHAFFTVTHVREVFGSGFKFL